MRDLTGKVAVVTGGGSGIGAGIVMALAGAGMNVAVADVEPGPATEVAHRARLLGVDAVPVVTDVTSHEAVLRLRSTVIDRWGAVHVLCNNAGVSVKRRGLDASHADWEWVLGVNLWGVVHGMEAFLPGMLESGRPCHVVNTASMNGLFPSARSPMYSASKYGVVGLTETFRNELAGTAVGISVLCPAAVESRIDESERNRPARLETDPVTREFVPSANYEISPARTPAEVGAMVVSGIRQKRFYLFTDPMVARYLDDRHRRMMAELRDQFDIDAAAEA